MSTPAIISPWGEPHPFLDRLYPPLTAEQVRRVVDKGGPEAVKRYVAEREKRRRRAEDDPLQFGWELPHWKDFWHMVENSSEVHVPGANGSGKTFWTAKLIVRFMCGWLVSRFITSHSGAKVLCIAQTDQMSKAFQQSAVYSFLPPHARGLNEQAVRRRGWVTKINYSVTGGFTNETLVLPNRSQAWFRTVEQYKREPQSFEGPEYDAVILDEGAPLALMKSLRFRASKRAGKIIYVLTSVNGYDPVFAEVFEGARLVKSLPMNWDWLHGPAGGPNPAITFPELDPAAVQSEALKALGVPAGHMPYIMQPLDFRKKIIFSWTHWNPFLPRGHWNPALPAVFDKCIGLPKWQVRVRLFGWIENVIGTQIGNFNPAVHVIPHERIQELLRNGRLTTRMAIDPHTARSDFIAWAGTDAGGVNYIIDESPRYDTEGEWVDANGEPGEGQKVFASMGVNWKKKHIREREQEHGIEAFLRFGDPRAFATDVAAAAGIRSLFEVYSEDHSDEDPDYGPMYVQPAKIRQSVKDDLKGEVEGGVVNLLAYDTRKAEREGGISQENSPRLFVSDRCQNIIRSWLRWDGKMDSPWKDPVDASARYLFSTPTYFVDPHEPDMAGGKGWMSRS